MDLQLQPNHVVIQFQNSLKIAHLNEQRSIYLEALAVGKAITLDGAALVMFDMASLQLLLCFIQTAKQRQLILTWRSISAELKEMGQLLGMSPFVNSNSN